MVQKLLQSRPHVALSSHPCCVISNFKTDFQEKTQIGRVSNDADDELEGSFCNIKQDMAKLNLQGSIEGFSSNFSQTYVMQSSKMSQNLQILIQRYGKTKKTISVFLFFVFFLQSLKLLFLKNQQPNICKVFTKLKLNNTLTKNDKKQKISTSDSFCLIA